MCSSKSNTMFIINLSTYFIGLIAFVVSWFFLDNDIVILSLSIVVFVFAGHHTMFEAIVDTYRDTKASRWPKPNTHVLMMIAAIGAMSIGFYEEASMLILIFAGAHFLEEFVSKRAGKEVKKLLQAVPSKAIIILPDLTEKTVDVDELEIGDVVRIYPGSQVSADGIIVSGSTSINQAAISGESMPLEKAVGDQVLAATFNIDGCIDVRVSKKNHDTVFAGIVKMVTEAQNTLSKTATFIKKLQPIYVNIVLLLTPLFFLLFFYGFSLPVEDAFLRTMVFLMVASPCALAVADVPATLSAIGNLAKRGILFKGGDSLANFADISTICFDKTGTITEGVPKVVKVVNFDDDHNLDVILVNMERKSAHPLALAIVNYYQDLKVIDLDIINEPGVGISTNYEGYHYVIAKPAYFNSFIPTVIKQTEEMQNDGNTVFYLAKDSQIVKIIAVCDPARANAAEVMGYFRSKSVKTVVLTGDAYLTAQKIAKEVGADEVLSDLLPDQKQEFIIEQRQTAITCMVGDGINDAPSLVAADVGIAMGQGTDIAIEVADGILMKNDITKLEYTHRLSRKLKRVIWQNIIFAMGVVLMMVIFNIIESMHMAVAVSIHEGSTLLVALNGLRLLIPVRKKTK